MVPTLSPRASYCRSAFELQWFFYCRDYCCCAGITQLGSRSTDIDGNVTFSYSTSPIPQAQCDAAAANMIKHLNSYNSTILNMLASQRLGDLKTTGKFAQRGTVASTLRTFLANRYPELVTGIYVDPKGADASDTAGATLDALTSLFVESSLYLVTGAPASLALYRRRLTGVSLHVCELLDCHSLQPVHARSLLMRSHLLLELCCKGQKHPSLQTCCLAAV